MASFDVQAAKRAGYNDQEIDQFMQQNGLRPKITPSGFGENLIKSGGNFVKNTVSGIANIANPNLDENTLWQIGNLAEGIVESIIPGEQGNEQYAQQLADYLANRYGSLDNIAQTFYSDPVGLLDDVSIVLTAGGSATTKLGKIGKIGKVADVGQDMARFGNKIDPLLAPARVIGGATKLGSSKLAKLGQSVEEAGKNYAVKGYGQPATLGKFEKRFRPAQELISEYGVYGKNVDALQDVIDNFQSLFDDIAKSSDKTISMETLLDNVTQEIERLSKSNIIQERRAADQLEKAFTIFMDNNADQINLADLTKQRVGYDKAVKTFYSDDVSKNVNQRMRDIIQRTIYSETGDVLSGGQNLQQLGQRLNELYTFQPIMEQAAKRGKSTRALSLGKMATTGVGGVLGGVKGAVAGYAADMLANSPAANKLVSSGLQKVGQTLKSGNLPQLKVPDMAKSAYDVTRAGRAIQRMQEKSKEQIFPKEEKSKKTNQLNKYKKFSRKNPFESNSYR